MNQVVLCGRLVKDPEVRYTSSAESMCVARYTLAVDRRGRRSSDGNEPTADFIPCVAFRKQGEFAEKYFTKGLRVLVSGHIQTGSYTNREGQKVYTTDVIVEGQEFADGKSTAGGSVQTERKADMQKAASQKTDEGFMDIPDNVDDDGLPWA